MMRRESAWNEDWLFSRVLPAILAVLAAACGIDALEAGEVRVHGRVLYQDRRGTPHPVRFARVKVFDENGPSRPAVVYRSSTDEDGYYEACIDNDSDADGSGADLRVAVHARGVMGTYQGARSSLCNILHPPSGRTHSISSPRHPDNTAAEREISFLVEAGESGAWAVYDSVVEAFMKSYDLLGLRNPSLPGLVVWWPTVGRAHYNVRGLHLPQDREWERDLIFHEYGHHIETMTGFGVGDVGTNCHWRRCYDLREQPDCTDPGVMLRQTPAQAMNLAFREAWATLFAVASQLGDTDYPRAGDGYYDDGDSRISLEDLTGSAGQAPGEFYECQTLGALWDIFDGGGGARDDDAVSDSSPRLGKIWRVISNYSPDNIQEFWDGWVREWGGQGEVARIFFDHRLGSLLRPGDVVENDLCGNAVELFLLPAGRVRVSGDTTLAGRDNAPCGASSAARGAWYRFTGTGNRVRITTRDPGSAFDTTLRIFTGDCSTLTCFAGNDDDDGAGNRLLSTLEIEAEAGADYFILLSGFADEAGEYVLHLLDAVPGLPEESDGVGPFRRGDSNGDSQVDVSDVSRTLGWLFLGGVDVPCRAAADSNIDGRVNIADITWVLGWLFLGGPAPKAPVECGQGRYASDADLGCEQAGCG